MSFFVFFLVKVKLLLPNDEMSKARVLPQSNSMSRKFKYVLLSLLVMMLATIIGFIHSVHRSEELILSYIVDPKKQDVQLYWKNDKGEILSNIQNLKTYVEGKNRKLIFAMNAGMFTMDHSPNGLFVQNFNEVHPLDTTDGRGNFYLKPNGVFYLTSNNSAFVCKTPDYIANSDIKYATQSGPMLLLDGKINSIFQKESKNLNIRNGVGILPDNRVVFAMSKKEITFYDFAEYFLQLGCKNALYLDGSISKTYLPEKNWKQMDGEFGVLIAITEDK
jgi:uncharacterized protein YigE (DUF2233 family)